MRYIDAKDLLVMHAKIVDATGGAHGVRDLNLLISAVERPKQSFGGKPVYKTVFEKAAALLEALARYHTFIDGNKRTSLAAAARFLHINSYQLTASNKEIEVFILKVIKAKPEISEIAVWLKRNSKKI